MKKTTKMMMAAGLLFLAATMTMGAVPAAAASKAPKIEDVEVKSGGKVEVGFKGRVQYRKVKVSVKDVNGKNYKVSVRDKDSDDIEFKVKKARKGMDYTFKITGIRKKGAGKYTSVSGSFRICADREVLVEEVEYDAEDKEVSFEFQGKVVWKNPRVTITDSNGKNYVKRIAETGRDELEAVVKKLKKGKTYSYKISGAAAKGSKNYVTITGKFKA